MGLTRQQWRRCVLLVGGSLLVMGCSGGGGTLGRPKITEAQIGSDIVGRHTGEFPYGWSFEKDEPRVITILRSDYSGNKSTVVINVATEPAPGSDSKNKWAGKLRLHYEWVAQGWTLTRVESLDFKAR